MQQRGSSSGRRDWQHDIGEFLSAARPVGEGAVTGGMLVACVCVASLPGVPPRLGSLDLCFCQARYVFGV